ncbi:AAA family ATPase [Paenibacillus sp. SM 69]|nr:AAA family ATPase [Paenibacillus oleatilyticus]
MVASTPVKKYNEMKHSSLSEGIPLAWNVNEKSLEPIGENGFTILYRGEELPSGETRLVKVLKDEYSQPSQPDWLHQEYKIGKTLPLGDILVPCGMISVGGASALVMEHADGCPLSSLLTPQPMELGLFLQWAVAASELIRRLHQLKFAHLALSASAFFVESDRKKMKLTDLYSVTPTTAIPDAVEEPPRYEAERLLYAAPEQTGRMNRRTDTRTDVYALGVLFYRMLTGVYPFDSEDACELVHQHMAKQPVPPGERSYGVPQPLSDIVMKCLAKHPEHRYQSAFALRRDLESCLKQLQTEGCIDESAVGGAEMSDQFRISDAIYGREAELQQLQGAYRRARLGNLEIVLVSGLSGIGKSYLIHEFQQSVQSGGGLFVTGKFDQFRRETPYHAIQQAGRQLLQHLLALPEEQFQELKQRILDAVVPNGQILVEMNPDVELILGKQPPLSKLPPVETHNRFILTLQKFLSAFMSKEQPLVIFLDDLQWADPSSVQIIEDLVLESGLQYGLFVGACRDREFSEPPPLQAFLDKMERSQMPNRTRIRLEPLQEEHIERMLNDSLRPSRQPVKELADLIMDKTKGNPFFTKQFFRTLYDHQLLRFNYDADCWEWDPDKIGELHITDNVVDFMINKIRRLSGPLQQVLMHAACVGHRFDIDTLAHVLDRPPDTIVPLLHEAVTDGLLMQAGLARQVPPDKLFFKFMHDRVYQAVYSLVPKERKKEIHLHIGRLLQNHDQGDAREERLFEMTNQLNLGSELMTLPEEKNQLARLNAAACRKAKTNSAYDVALRYAAQGIALLEEDCWERQYELTFSLQLDQAELEYLCGRFEEAKRSFQTVLKHARTKLEKAEACNLMIVLFTNMGEHEEALRIGLEGLKLFGLSIRPNPGKLSIGRALVKAYLLVGTRHSQEVLDLPVMTDPNHKTVMRLMVNLTPPAYFLNSELYVYLMLQMFNYSLVHGHSEGSALACSTYGIILSSLLGRLEAGMEYGRLGAKLSDTFNDLSMKCKVYFAYGSFTSNAKEHIEASVRYLRKAYQYGVESGDFIYAGYSIAFSFFMRLLKGDPLAVVLKETDQYHAFIHKAKDRDTIWIYTVLQRYMMFLKEDILPAPAGANDCDPFMNANEAEQMKALTNQAIAHTYYALQAQTYLLLDRPDEAKAICETAEAGIKSVFGLPHVHLHHFHYALALAGLYAKAPAKEQKAYKVRIRKSIRFLEKWSTFSPDNFLAMKLLVEAEWHRISGNPVLAVEKYDQAIHHASKNGFLPLEAMAGEYAVKFYMQTGKLKVARSYFMEARSLYAKWGANRKVSDLAQRYPSLLGRVQTGESTIDLSCMMKASQAISNEAVFQHMLESIMTILLENAGADKGLLVLERNSRLFVEAEKALQAPFKSLHSAHLDDCRSAAVTVIQFAARTGETVLLHDATASDIFARDAYILAQRPKSILCVPILKQSKLIGALYLENSLASHVFQETRLDTLKLLAAEVAMLVENSKLYDHLEYKDCKLQLMEEREKNIRLQLDEKERWVQSAESTMLNIRKAQHELINNVQTVHALLMMNKFDMAKEYISVWCKEIVQHSVIGSVEFPVLGVVLSNLSLICIAEKIDLQVAGKLDCTFEELTLPICYFSSIMYNLLKNAVEAIPADDLLRIVRLTIEESDDRYTVSVFNTGSYVKEEDRLNLFEKGFSTKSDVTNSGLGLHIVQNYLQHYGGDVECHSDPGKGTTFTVHLCKKGVRRK